MGAISGGIAWKYRAFDAGIVRDCEDKIISRLRSPSSYKRINAEHRVRDLDESELWRRLLAEYGMSSDAKEDLLRKAFAVARASSVKPYEDIAVIEFDAANGFGAPIRDRWTCDETTYGVSANSSTTTAFRVNGKTLAEELNSR